MTTDTNLTAANPDTTPKGNGQAKPKDAKPRVITNPGDVAGLVLMQIDAVNSRKDDLTLAIKLLADTARQLVRAYAQQAAAIEKLKRRVGELENSGEK